MGRFYGTVGYLQTVEDSQNPGVWKEVITEKNYYGDIVKYGRRWDNGEQLNDNISISNQFSIIADAFAYTNLGYIRYIKWMGTSWKVTSVDVQRPRIILTAGGVYNGPEN